MENLLKMIAITENLRTKYIIGKNMLDFKLQQVIRKCVLETDSTTSFRDKRAKKIKRLSGALDEYRLSSPEIATVNPHLMRQIVLDVQKFFPHAFDDGKVASQPKATTSNSRESSEEDVQILYENEPIFNFSATQN